VRSLLTSFAITGSCNIFRIVILSGPLPHADVREPFRVHPGHDHGVSSLAARTQEVERVSAESWRRREGDSRIRQFDTVARKAAVCCGGEPKYPVTR
jgi:hypothetical protein